MEQHQQYKESISVPNPNTKTLPQQYQSPDCSCGTCIFGSNSKFNQTAEQLQNLHLNELNHPVRRKNKGKKKKAVKKKGKERNESVERPDQKECKYHLRTGWCKYGKACRKNHAGAKTGVVPTLELNFLGLPIRPGENVCLSYMHDGSCKNGANCWFHHPGPRAVNNNHPGPRAVNNKNKKGMIIEGYPVEGLSISGHETCIIFPTLNLAFDIGQCLQRAISLDFLLISHAHMDHIGGLQMYVAARGLRGMKPPTIVVPKSIKQDVEQLFELHRKMDQSELQHNLIGLDVGEEFYLRKDLKVRAFRTYHVIQSQGYVVYSIRQKLKQEYLGLSGRELSELKRSGVEIMYTITTPEVAFTGDTTSEFIVDETNVDALRARVLVVESTFVEKSMAVEHARNYGHTHLSEIVNYADRFENKANLLSHFSARYSVQEIQEAVSALPPPLGGRVFALTEGLYERWS